jgi:hypothetical protein
MRPAFCPFASLAHLLAEPAAAKPAPPAGLRPTLTVTGVGRFPDASRVHHLLLRRASGTLLLLHEVSGEDASVTPRGTIAAGPLPARSKASAPPIFVVGGETKIATRAADILVPEGLLMIEITR